MPISPQIVITPEDIVFKSFAISAVSYTSTTATYTATGHTLSAGDIVQITGVAPDGYNGTYTISSVATNTFTVANTTNTALTDQVGNAYWADPTEYEYDGGQTVAFIPNDNDVNDLIDTNPTIAAIEIAVNGKNKIYRQATAPTGTLTIGDIWFDTSAGNRQYYWNGTAWIDVQDTAIAAAQSAATAAQTTADGKNKIYRQGTTPTGTFVAGDLWFNTSSDNAISRWDGTSWVLNSLGNNALANLSANKITSGTIDASVITVSNINAGNISTGTLAADRIAAASITGTKIAAGTILASNIATGTITATQIAAGTITSSQIAAGTITADRITTGAIGGFTITSTYLGGSGGFTLYSNGVIDGGLSNTIFYGYANIGGGPATGERFIVTGNSSFVGQAIFSGNTTSQTHFFSPFATNVTSAANGYWVTSGSGRMTYTTASSQRYKHDIVDLVSISEYDPKKLLNLPVRAFRYNEDYVTPTDDRAEVLIPGFIAEEVDAIYPIACDYSETKGPESWNDRVILPAMLALIQDLYQEIDKLKGGINGTRS